MYTTVIDSDGINIQYSDDERNITFNIERPYINFNLNDLPIALNDAQHTFLTNILSQISVPHKIKYTDKKRQALLYTPENANKGYKVYIVSSLREDQYEDYISSVFQTRFKTQDNQELINCLQTALIDFYKRFYHARKQLEVALLKMRDSLLRYKLSRNQSTLEQSIAYFKYPRELRILEKTGKKILSVKPGGQSELSNQFLYRFRIQTPTGTGNKLLSVYSFLTDDEYATRWKTIARKLMMLKVKGLNTHESTLQATWTFPTVLKIVFASIKIPGTFPDSLALWLYKDSYSRYSKTDTLGNDEFYKIGDPCAGWGNRLIGAAMLVNALKIMVQYTGVDPSLKVEAYNQGFQQLSSLLKNILSTLNPESDMEQQFQARFIAGRSETQETMNQLGDAKFHVVMTSPPYYDKERYTAAPEDQAWNVCQSESNFLNQFLTPMFRNYFYRLHVNGLFYLNVPSAPNYHEALSKFSHYQIDTWYYNPGMSNFNTKIEAIYVYQHRERLTPEPSLKRPRYLIQARFDKTKRTINLHFFKPNRSPDSDEENTQHHNKIESF